MQLRFEIVAAAPWSEAFPPTDIPPAMIIRGGATAAVRQVPALRRAPDGALWVTDGARLARLVEGRAVAFDTRAAETDAIDYAPLADGGVIVLGRRGKTNTLARLDPQGRVVWRREGPMHPRAVDLETLRGKPGSLAVDPAGGLILSMQRMPGALARLDPATGALEALPPLPGSNSTWRAAFGWIFRLKVVDGAPAWARRPVADPDETTLKIDHPAPIGEMYTLTGRPDGGLFVEAKRQLLVFGAKGEIGEGPTLAGVARRGGALLVAERTPGGLTVRRGGVGEPLVTIAEAGRLVGADERRFVVLAGQEAVHLDAAGRVIEKAPIDDGWRARNEARVDPLAAVPDADGGMLWPAVDGAGLFVIRVTTAR